MGARVAIDHPRFQWAERDIFIKRVVADCMTHACHENASGRQKLDACCQYGADVDAGERDAILGHRAAIAAILDDGPAAAAWFSTDEEADPDFPSGRFVRTSTWGQGCLFLAHDGRGCAIHRAALETGFELHGVKPHVCRLFPLTYDSDSIVLSDDYPDYSCAQAPSSPTVYRVARADLGQIFGPELVCALDRAEKQVAHLRAL